MTLGPAPSLTLTASKGDDKINRSAKFHELSAGPRSAIGRAPDS